MIQLIQGKYESAKKHYEEVHGTEYFEFCFFYVPAEESFRELDRFLWESRHDHTRFGNKYRGSVLVDLSAWNNREPNEYFDAFMYFMKDNDFPESAFLVHGNCSSALLERLERFFQIEKIVLEPERRPCEKQGIGFSLNRKENVNVRI